ncbi:hypothetical protein TNCV_4795341 [Trichonephila clavipes]|nr:hypothetical protein TNCV_4795341 [Trichonephila clavipes]
MRMVDRTSFEKFTSVPTSQSRRCVSLSGQPIGVTVHSTQQPIREQLLSSKPRQKLLKIYHPDEAQKPRLPDPIVQPIAVMPLRRT